MASGYVLCPCCGFETVATDDTIPELCSDCEEHGCGSDGSDPCCGADPEVEDAKAAALQVRSDLVELYRSAAATERSAGFFDTAFLYEEIAHAAEQGFEVQKVSRFKGLGADFATMLKGESYRRAYLAAAYG